MEKLLIVNADDFGLCKGQCYGIIEAFRHGIVSSTTAMMNCADIHHAAELSQQNPALPVGMHFVLTYGRPLTAMPSLVDTNGLLGKGLWQSAEADALNLGEIAQELAAQFEQFVAVFGRSPTHIDSHHHVHMLPQIYPLVETFARENHSRYALTATKRNSKVSCSMNHERPSGLMRVFMARRYRNRHFYSGWIRLTNRDLARWK